MAAADVTSRYTRRNQREYEKVAEYIQTAVQGRKGNYLVFFPSYQYLKAVEEIWAQRMEEEQGEIVECSIEKGKLKTNVEVLDIVLKEKEKFIESADVLVVAGRGVKKEEDLLMLEELADLLGGQVACTRPVAENGWLDAKRQVGLSGRTVRPKLIITCGVSGAIQFVAGMDHSDQIIAINKDEKASIFKVAHYGLVGDLYEVIPQFIEKIKESQGA